MASLLYNYDGSIDSTNAFNSSRELVALLNLNAAGVINNPANKSAIMSSYPESVQSVEEVFESMESRYKDMLGQINMVNNLNNLTVFAETSYNAESDRAHKLRDATVTDVYKMRSNYMGSRWTTEYNRYVTRIYVFTLFCAAIIAAVTVYGLSNDKKTVMYITVTTVFLIYLIVLFFAYKNMSFRRNDDWSKFYFAAPKV